jgi:hypothetical protein
MKMRRKRAISASLIVLLLLGLVGHLRGWFTSENIEAQTQAFRENHLPFKTEDDPASKDASGLDFLTAQGLVFTWGDGSGLRGYDVVKVRPDGTVIYTFQPRNATWKRAQFTIDAPTQQALRQLLKDIDYWRLKKAYYASVADGTQRFVKVEAAGKRKAIYCSNYFPAEVIRIKQFVEARIISANSAAVGRAVPIVVTIQNAETEDFK